MSREYKSVHDAHCCLSHGCKYGDYDCPVILEIEDGIECEMCVEDKNNPDPRRQKKLVAALHEAHAALCRGRGQIQGALVQQDFDSAIKSAEEALEAVEGKPHETNIKNPVDFPTDFHGKLF
jgi:hypothetical protein